ncbi:MAG: thiamine biosynthesis protein ThiS [Bacilli bacterium]|jgi:sulfur carrier protein|nr:thiamine biosynthesis protein ThiS [Bacilli bacterium]
MKLHVNGEIIDMENDIDTISALLTYFQLEQKIVIVELNKQIVDKSAHGQTTITDGDYIELVHFVGGG